MKPGDRVSIQWQSSHAACEMDLWIWNDLHANI